MACLSAGAVVGGAGLVLASSAPSGPVGGGVEVGSRSADEGVEQPSQLGHGQRDELAGSGGGPPYLWRDPRGNRFILRPRPGAGDHAGSLPRSRWSAPRTNDLDRGE